MLRRFRIAPAVAATVLAVAAGVAGAVPAARTAAAAPTTISTAATAAASTVGPLRAVAGETTAIPLPAAAGEDTTVRVTKVAPLAPALVTAYLPTGVVYTGPPPAAGEPLQFLFWDPGTYRVDLVTDGAITASQTVQSRPDPGKVAATALAAVLIGLLGFLAGWTSRRLPRPGRGAAALLVAAALLAPAAGLLPGGSALAARLHTDPDLPAAGEVATLQLPAGAEPPPGTATLTLEHVADGLTLLTTAWSPAAPLQYRFPEGGAYVLRLSPAAGGPPAVYTVAVAEKAPTLRQRLSGWLQWAGVFFVGGLAGFGLARRRGRRRRAGSQ